MPRFEQQGEAVMAAIYNTVQWLFAKQLTGILVDVANECNEGGYDGTDRHSALSRCDRKRSPA